MKRRYHLIIWPAVGIITLDQISKFLVVDRLSLHESIPVVNGFFNLVHVRNRGMAFGLMNRPDMDLGFYLLLAASLGAVVLLLIWSWQLKEREDGLAVGLSFILGGAAGNLIDRLRFREVIDFLDFHWGSVHWPAFNLADAAITGGTIWVAVMLLYRHKSRV